MNVREFNQAGIDAAREFLSEVREGRTEPPSPELLEDDGLSLVVSTAMAKVPNADLVDRWSLGVWLYQQLDSRLDKRLLLTSNGLWTWMALRLFDLICPIDSSGGRRVRAEARYILDRSNRRRWYRHLIAGPYLLVRAHEDNIGRLRAVLAGVPSAPGEIYEQLAGRSQLITSLAVLDVATRLYWKSDEKVLKRGAGGKGPGSPRRYGVLLNQFDVTFDLARIHPDRLESLLPREFGKFLR